MTFFDSSGRAVAYCDDGDTIYLFNGIPVAYFYGSLLYTFNGRNIGTFQNGWVRDNRGLCVFFTEDATGGPIKPIKQIKPIKNVKMIKPLKGIRHIPFIKPLDQLAWSPLTGERFFLSVK